MKRCANNGWFEFDTTSKYKNHRSCDCVVRSISLASGKSWQEVYDDLCEIGRKMFRMPNEVAVYGKYLESIGFKKMPAPRRSDNTRILARDFVRKFNGKAVAHVGGHHLSCFINNKIHDIWDCGAGSVGNYWVYNQN